ncbi:PepSY domain-containing protein [Muriicola sp. Z0-33]|uniref:PepSY domain-containing protein n=1 Tax=Muriicola sp. Z0-33 TaxID=2816957 RepID=UPI002237544F|nr:PepSY domain-containing protein [Muriicola sp. Z0-33]MCW5515476.1 PepSY domain-containing protein [Muriicola sp. Z0-33]
MVKRHAAVKIRKIHRYLGVFLGIQFLMWTISGLYFSWTDIDEIHGDHFKQLPPVSTSFTGLLGISEIKDIEKVSSMELLEIAEAPYYWINSSVLYNAITGELKEQLTSNEALKVAARYMQPSLKVATVKLIEEVGPHHEYRGRPLPAYEISYQSKENLKAYVAVQNGAFQTVRHRNWRWFDFLWMTHTMDYKGRDNFNTSLLRIFSLLGLLTVLSGFTLWFTSSPRINRLMKRKYK